MRVLESGHANSLKNGVIYSPQEEKRIVKELNDQAESNLQEGNLYYVVSSRWFIGWQRYTEQEGEDCEMNGNTADLPNPAERPGPIDNSDLILNVNGGDADNLELLRTLEEGQHYVLVPEEVWKKLLEWYNGGPPLPRKLISQGAINKKFNVEVYPLSLKLTDSRDNSQSDISFSKKASTLELYEKVCALKGLPQDKVQIWDYFNEKKQCILVPSGNKTLEDANLQMDQHILFEVRTVGEVSAGLGVLSTGNELALVPMEPSRSAVTIAGGPSFTNGYSTRYSSNLYSGLSTSSTAENGGHDSNGSQKKKEKGGLAGLQNLGNTCFMNSALQCLFHTAPLVEYFLQNYTDEINKQNPLGMHGELAISFGDLLREMWSSGRTSIAPRHFKGKLARFAPQFSGYNQHDSQELLAFLLDGLHEDLNRVKQKPYIEMKDSDGRPDEEYAEECWRSHKARNDSIIVDTCQGQYKSTLVCPVCNKISITFDPFMYLSLPLPSMTNRTMTVTVLYTNGVGLPMPYTVTVSKHGCCRDLIQALGTACCLKTDESLLLAEVYDHKIYRYMESAMESLSSIKDDEHIVAYRVPKKLGLKKLEIVHQSTEKKLLGSPLVTYLQEEPQTVADVWIAITSILSPLRKAHVPLSKNHSEKENGSLSGGNDETENGFINDSAECKCSSDLPFQLTVTEDRLSSIGRQIDDDYVRSSSFLRVTLHWTDNVHELYDISYLEDFPEVCKSGFTAKKTRQEAVSLFSCMDAFLKEEPLGPDDMWYCPNCKEHRQASKKLDLWKLPEILVIHLKRFSYSRYFKNKLDTFVSFPIQNLELDKYVKEKDSSNVPYMYELYAISNHYGGLGGGHYSAYAKLIEEDKWYHFDDSHVSPVSEADIKTSAAYVLFYRRVKVEAKSEARG
ncbi:ubiquitin carboxyl-terminal hydrolase 10-like [Chenopodium quinoa]|uniref:ubiquitin carboxyl-terminal hydrolase 10-like n=1 Tax=Chenopodium quinoa TaxID=63459 RepID=UPI000B795772|nr:ubiquitin carboxyl-terminal hydrolase 10-like [Chenopodium quinoa]